MIMMNTVKTDEQRHATRHFVDLISYKKNILLPIQSIL